MCIIVVKVKTLINQNLLTMKKFNYLLIAFLFVASILQSCKKEDELKTDENTSIIPTSFKVDIPASISSSSSKKALKAGGDTLQGNEIYSNLRTFIAIGENGAQFVQNIMTAIQVYNINKAIALSYTDGQDNRQKNLVVLENVTFASVSYQYMLTISDAASIDSLDKGVGLQVMWNTSPVEGIAIIKPKNTNRNDAFGSEHPNVMIQIHYSETKSNGYDAEMTVSINGLTMPVNPVNDQIYAISELKMFAGRKDDIIEVRGSSNHPLAKFTSDSSAASGFNWAFVAAGYKENVNDEIAVVELGLPPSGLNSTVRDTLLGNYSLQNVFFREIKKVYPWATDEVIMGYLKNADAPGYFNKSGFVQSKNAPTGTYNSLYESLRSKVNSMTPYNPKDIDDLSIVFKP